jgi:hypothetical protein
MTRSLSWQLATVTQCPASVTGPRRFTVLAISGEVDTESISTGDGWTEGTRGILRFQRKNVAFLKEWVGFFRIPGSGSYRITS